jgi:transposase
MELREGVLTRRGTVYVLDAAQPLHAAIPSRCWIERTMTVTTNSGRNRRTSIGAYSPDDQCRISWEGREACAVERVAHVLQLRAQAKPGTRLLLIRDNARSNHAPPVTDAAKARRIERAEYLPPSSPNLNLIARLWKFVGRKVARNRYHATFAAFHAAVQKVLNNLPAYRAERASLLTERFQRFTTP